jgi:hypothetical protein
MMGDDMLRDNPALAKLTPLELEREAPSELDLLALTTLAHKGYGCMSCTMDKEDWQSGPVAYISVPGHLGIPTYEEFKNENIYL